MLFIEGMEKHDKNISMEFINSWTHTNVNINRIGFKIMEVHFASIKELFLEGKTWCKKPRVTDEASLRKFIKPNQESIYMHGEFSHEDLLKLFDVIFYGIMRYITLEDQFKV